MATLAQLEKALVNADKAGDMDAARKLAAVINRERARLGPSLNIPGTADFGDVPGTVPDKPGESIGKKIAGVGEAALSVVTGIPAAIAGGAAGMAKGIYDQVRTGGHALDDGVDEAANLADRVTSAMTYAPRTQTGQAITQKVGEVSAPLAAFGPAAAELGAVADSVAAVRPVARAIAAERVIDPVKQAATTLAEQVKQKIAPTPSVVAPAAAGAPAVPVAAPAPNLSSVAKEAAVGTGRSQTRAQSVLAKEAAPDAETLAAAKRLGIDDNLQPDHVTTNQAFRELSQAVKSMPGSMARAQEIEGLQAVGARADKLIADLGGTKDLSTLSDNIKTQMLKSGEDLEKVADGLYTQIRESIPISTQVQTPSVLEFINARAKELGGKEHLGALEKSILAKLTPKNGNAPLYGLVDDVRKTIGQATKMSGPFKDADTGLAKKLYGLVTKDQEAVADQFGLSGINNAAKAAVRTRKSLEDDTVSLFGKSIGNSIVGNLSGSVTALGKGDTSKFINLISAVPKNLRQETTASALNYAFGKATQNGSLNFNTFARWYEGLQQNRQAFDAVMANLPKEARQSLADLYRVSNGISMASKERIVTGRLNAITKEIEGADTAIQRIYAVARKSAGIMAAEAASSSVGAPGVGLASGITSALMKGKPDVMKAADKLISDPAFISMAKSSTLGQAPKAAAVKELAGSKNLEGFRKSLGNPPEMKNLAAWLTALFLVRPQDTTEGN